MNNPLRIERNGDQGTAYFWIIASGYWGYWPLAPATAACRTSRDCLPLRGSGRLMHRAIPEDYITYNGIASVSVWTRLRQKHSTAKSRDLIGWAIPLEKALILLRSVACQK